MWMKISIINFKLSKNGKFQITGCKDEKHATYIIKTFWDYVKQIKKDEEDESNESGSDEEVTESTSNEVETINTENTENEDIYSNEENFKAILFTVMTNIDFSVGFIINRESLDRYINSKTEI